MNQLLLFDHYLLYIGRSFETILHRHHAAQVCIGLDHSFQLIDENGQADIFRAAVIAANAAHKLEAPETDIATIFLDIQSEAYQTVLKQYQLCAAHPFQSLDLSQQLITDLGQLYSGTLSCQSAKCISTQIISELTCDYATPTGLDGRIDKVLKQLNSNIDSQIPLEKLAQSVNLSTSRLVHLFKAEVGTPIRRYSLWRRIRVAMEYAINHKSLTAGAHYAGFTDSAHFSRIFKQMYGINPSAIVNKQMPLKVTFE